jgi:hypothetical protein
MRNNTFSNRIVKSFKLKSKDGAVGDVISVYINAKELAEGFKKCKSALINAERSLKDAQKRNDEHSFNVAVEDYAFATWNMLELVFGTEYSKKLLEFYGERYFDLAHDIAPFIKKKIIPVVNRYKKSKKDEAKNIYKKAEK